MKILLQRVKEASVSVDGVVIGAIGAGLLAFLGVSESDTPDKVLKMVEKVAKLRIFEDEHGKINRSITDTNGEILIISQFTLYADTSRGHRPSFPNAAPPQLARSIYDHFIISCQGRFAKVAEGEFGAMMDVSLVNDGPFTIMLES